MTTTTNTPVDAETYIMLQEIMADEFAELVEFFITDTDQCIITLKQSVEIHDSAQVGAICHKLKSSSKLIGAFELAELAHLLEDYRENNDQQAAAVYLEKLQAEHSKVLEWLKQQPVIAY
ncbi:Hpt domain-containing protein [Thiothrix lacustris]|uniref:Hpt domain-containing protein n=1 Tax=Thiothrix lacustris TaxID=525917 RepID=A0ABY9MTG9_9GAMM|nr:Hpt domain-containing protein [Thiothrix lacustris]WML91461.1 Hpt domain-containing protein [Thiothrix lacustris]